MEAIKEFFSYLYGKQFILLTHHNPLTSLRGLKDTGREAYKLASVPSTILHVYQVQIWKNNANVDGLSRRPSEEMLKMSHVISASSVAEDDGLVLVNGIAYLGDVEELKHE